MEVGYPEVSPTYDFALWLGCDRIQFQAKRPH